jgi:hypothetical protein
MLFLALLCGVAAAVLRGFQLVDSFHPATALIERGDLLTAGLIALSATFVVVTAVYAFVFRKTKPLDKPLGYIWQTVQFAALAALLAASGVDLYNGFADGRISIACLGVLGLFACGALSMIALNINKLPFTSATGFWATVPVFWACLLLVAEFWGQMGNPVRNTYVYGMLATVCCTLALYTLAGFFFDRVKPGRVLFLALPGIYFATLTAGGTVFGSWLGEPAVALPISATLRLAFIALHLTAAVAAVLHGRFTPPAGAAELDIDIEKEDA